MQKVIYVSKADTVTMYNVLNTSTLKSILLSGIQQAASYPYLTAVDVLVAEGLTNTAARAVLKVLGRFTGLFTAAEALIFVSDLCKLSTYRRAVTNNYGMINATYYTAYNGAWYSQYGEDTWTTANTVYLPSTYYGTGSYTSY